MSRSVQEPSYSSAVKFVSDRSTAPDRLSPVPVGKRVETVVERFRFSVTRKFGNEGASGAPSPEPSPPESPKVKVCTAVSCCVASV